MVSQPHCLYHHRAQATLAISLKINEPNVGAPLTLHLGKRFAEVESVAFLSHLVKDYTFKPVPIKSGETWDEMRARLWKGTEELNLMPSKFALKFERRA